MKRKNLLLTLFSVLFIAVFSLGLISCGEKRLLSCTGEHSLVYIDTTDPEQAKAEAEAVAKKYKLWDRAGADGALVYSLINNIYSQILQYPSFADETKSISYAPTHVSFCTKCARLFYEEHVFQQNGETPAGEHDVTCTLCGYTHKDECRCQLIFSGEGLEATDCFCQKDSAKYLTEENEDGTLTARVYPTAKGDVVIPSEINGKTVTAVTLTEDFQKTSVYPFVTGLTIPESVTEINLNAQHRSLLECYPSLLSLKIEGSASENGSSMIYVKQPSGNPHPLKTIDAPNCYLHTSYLQNIETITAKGGKIDVTSSPNAVLTLTSGTPLENSSKQIYAPTCNFAENVTAVTGYSIIKAETVNAPNVTEFSNVSFENVKVVNAPNLQIIGDETFLYCETLESITLENVVEIGKNAISIDSLSQTNILLKKIESFYDSSFRNVNGKTLTVQTDSDLKINCYYGYDSIFKNDIFDELTIQAKKISIENVADANWQSNQALVAKRIALNADEISIVGVNVGRADATAELSVSTNNLHTEKLSGSGTTVNLIGESFHNNIVNADKRFQLKTSEYHVGKDVVTLCGIYSSGTVESITFADNGKLTTLAENSLNCSFSFTKLTLPEGITTIRSKAFSTDLVEITLPSSVQSVEAEAFYDCNELQTIHRAAGSTYTLNANVLSKCWNYKYELDNGVYYFEKTAVGFDTSNDTNSFVVRAGTTEIINQKSFENHKVEQVTLPNGLLSIGNNVFQNTNVSTIVLPDSLLTIGENAFENSQLTSVEIPESVREIGEGAFSNCSNLQYAVSNGTVELNDTHTENCPNYKGLLQDGFFYKGTVLTGILDKTNAYVRVKDGVTEIAQGVFENNTALKTVYIPKSVTAIAKNQFKGCSNVTVIYGGSQVGSNSTLGLNDVKQVLTLANVTEDWFVYDISSSSAGVLGYFGDKTEIVIPATIDGKNVTTLGSSVGKNYFASNTQLTKVTVGENVNVIYGGTFQNCTALREVIIPESVLMLNNKVFEGCTSLKTVTIEGDNFDIYSINYDPSTEAGKVITVSANDANLIKYLTDTYTDYLWIRNMQFNA